jgi:hypothetical protein
MRMMLDKYLLEIGTGDLGLNERVLDLSIIGIPQFTDSNIQIYGEHFLGQISDRDSEKDWVEGALVKSPQTLITSSECGLSHKKNLYTIFVKTPKEKGLYYNEAVSAIVEEHFPNNKHLRDSGNTITFLKTFQQPTTYLVDNLGRFQNRIFVESEIYYNSNNI